MERVLAGRYELEAPLGRGGSGEVWRGTDLATHRPVAVKLVELSTIDDPTLLAETIGRFRREATVISGLRHPNIVSALDAGRIGSYLFMIMDLAPGISLAAMMEERAARGMGLFPVTSVLRMTDQVCAGLGAAHAAGVVHRDVKPSNLMVTPSLGVKVIDFSVARLLADNAPRLTMPEHTVGTIAYMSPEQAQAIEVDARADLYSLGCVLYQLLSGRPPFISNLPSALLMMQVMDRPVPLASLRPDLPAELCQLVTDLMEKEPAARPASAAEVTSRIAAIREAIGDEETEYEVDRQTMMSSDNFGMNSLTRREASGFPPEEDRATVLTSERADHPSGPDALADAVPWAPAAQALQPAPPVTPAPLTPAQSASPTNPVPPANPFQPAQPFRQSMPLGLSYPPVVPPQSGPLRSGPTTPPTVSTGTPVAPEWPGPRRGRRSGWAGVVSTLITAALVAGGGAYYWIHTHQSLKIEHVEVAAANPRVGCNGDVDLVGTITTNGHGGPISYQWILNQAKEGVLQAAGGTGSDTVKVTMTWPFHVRGTGQEVAELKIISPQQTKASITIPFSCPK